MERVSRIVVIVGSGIAVIDSGAGSGIAVIDVVGGVVLVW
jgi:hypothetical protein